MESSQIETMVHVVPRAHNLQGIEHLLVDVEGQDKLAVTG